MFTLPNFCRVCLKYDKSLIDLEHIENEPNETLMSKLQQCVQEVEWSVFKPLLCHPCIKRLNTAYMFKKQCITSSSVLKNYVHLVNEESKKKNNESQSPKPKSTDAYMMLPNQKYVKIVVGPNQQQQHNNIGTGSGSSSFQNVFLNVVPTTTSADKKPKDPKQNVFLNINNTFQKFITAAASQGDKEKNVNAMLNENTAEEMSVEIDPNIFGLDDNSAGDEEEEEEDANDWEDLISQSQIDAKRSNGTANGNSKHYVPILPKSEDFGFSGQHFLSGAQYPGLDFNCEHCSKHFATVKLLKNHIKEFHLGKFPFKCDYCYNEFMLRHDYEACIKSHKAAENDPLNTSLTLRDFKMAATAPERAAILPTGPEHNLTPEETMDLKCELCHRQFNSTSGLLRHKVRKHNQKNKKKYFIKGMKNAKCDICNREFSTQSYMQLHRKLHLRDDIGYKYKVFSKSRYSNNKEGGESDDKTTPEKKLPDDTEEVTITPVIQPQYNSDSDDETKNESLIMDNPLEADPLADSNNDEDDSKMEYEEEEKITVASDTSENKTD